MAIIDNVLVLHGISPCWQGIVSGTITVLPSLLDSTSRRYFPGR